MQAKSGPPRFPRFDKRLFGTWKSDKRRTFLDWNWRKNTSPKKKAKLKSLFGKLNVTYTRTKVISMLRHRNWAQARQYIVLATDENTTAIVKYGPMEMKNRRRYDAENLKMVEEMFPPTPAIEHIHFDKKHYWICIGHGRNREFFRKIR